MIKKYGKLFWISVFIITVIFISATAYISNKQKNTVAHNELSTHSNQLIYVCSMHPQISQDKPGDCPICGMTLVEKADKDENSADARLQNVVRSVNESVLASVQTVSPIREKLPFLIETSGIINYDTRNVSIVCARFGGLIEKSFVKYSFQPIHKGQKIYEIYCPDIYTEKWNYVKLLQNYPDQDNLTVESREWLKLLGLSDGQIDSLKRATKPDYHLSVYSDVEGFAVSTDFNTEQFLSSGSEGEINTGKVPAGNSGLGLNDGVIIEAGTPLFKVVTTESVRADLRVKTEEAGFLRVGQNVLLVDVISPELKYYATVNQIEPFNGGIFQLVKVYIKNAGRLLSPGRQIRATIEVGLVDGLWLPKTAIVNLGQHQSVFILQDSTFVATAVRTGVKSGDKIEVVSTIEPNSKCALNASLLTDSDGFIMTNSSTKKN